MIRLVVGSLVWLGIPFFLIGADAIEFRAEVEDAIAVQRSNKIREYEEKIARFQKRFADANKAGIPVPQILKTKNQSNQSELAKYKSDPGFLPVIHFNRLMEGMVGPAVDNSPAKSGVCSLWVYQIIDDHTAVLTALYETTHTDPFILSGYPTKGMEVNKRMELKAEVLWVSGTEVYDAPGGEVVTLFVVESAKKK